MSGEFERIGNEKASNLNQFGFDFGPDGLPARQVSRMRPEHDYVEKETLKNFILGPQHKVCV
jgi:hypothetical protein